MAEKKLMGFAVTGKAKKAGKKGGKAKVDKGFASKKIGKDGLTGKQRAKVVGRGLSNVGKN